MDIAAVEARIQIKLCQRTHILTCSAGKLGFCLKCSPALPCPASHTYAGSFCYLCEVLLHDHCVTRQLPFVKAAMQVNYEPMLFCEMFIDFF